MNVFDTSLRCLTHPLSVLSIGLLLMNDHLLKAVFPSWFTGKLSDFAGLLFFPFLVSIVIGMVLSPMRMSPRRVGQLSILVTAVCFALVKVVPFVNAGSERWLSCFLGAPVSIALDPTDLLALCVLGQSWRMWNRPAVAANGRTQWVVLALALLAGIGTSQRGPNSMERLAAAGDTLYIGGSNPRGGGHGSARRAHARA